MADEADDYFAKEARRRRWIALHEDGDMFGLVPAEQAELARLDQEFSAPTGDKPHD